MIDILKGDLHCHTKYSDGSMDLLNVALLAVRTGLDFLSVTDHDTVRHFDKVKDASNRFGIEIIPGVELSAYDTKRSRKVHILCYMPIDIKLLDKHCQKVCESRRETARRMAQLVTKAGYPISFEDVEKYADGSQSVYKQHIMHALADRGYTTSIFGELFDKLFNSKTGSCYLSNRSPDVYEVLDVIERAGGVAVLAHPGEYNSYELMEELCAQGRLDGIEVWHSRNRDGDEERFIKTADRYGLIKTGGSDFHGFYSSRKVTLGSCFSEGQAVEQIKRLHDERLKKLESKG